MVSKASCKDFADLGDEIINNYVWTVREIVYRSIELNDELSGELAKIIASAKQGGHDNE